ncbi:MAG: cobalamin-dependent protein, partial [Planctomycetota bacterium]
PEHWEIVYEEVDRELTKQIQKIKLARYDMVAISSLTARILDAYFIADQLRSTGIPVILGGLHVSMLPEEALTHATAIVQGEGELIWSQVIEDFENGKLQSVYATSKGSRSRSWFEKIPRYDLLNVQQYQRIPLQTTRGCPLDCSFCAASRLISSYKIKPILQVQQELESILALWPRPFIELADDNTFVSKTWARSLAKLFSQYPLKWFTETDISVAEDEELLKLLAESHCAQLLIGFESTLSQSLYSLDSRHWKYQQREHYLKQIQKIQSYGISVNGCFIVGFDEDTPESISTIFDFVQDSELSEVQITILTPFPGTALYQKLKQEGRLLKPIFWESCTLFDVTYVPKKMSPDALESTFLQLAQKLYSTEETQKRKQIRTACFRKKH